MSSVLAITAATPAPAEPPSPTQRIAALDGVRAIAIIMVMARHSVLPFHVREWNLAGYDLATPLLNGWIGVDLFFALSGYLIAQHLVTRYDGTAIIHDFGTYVRRRAWRILPAYLAVLAVVVLGLIPYYRHGSTNLVRDVAVHLAMWQDQGDANLLVGFWSLGVEEKFYLVAPMLVWAAMRLGGRRRVGLLVAVAGVPSLLRVATLAASGPATTYTAWFQRFRSPAHLTADALLLGLALAVALREPVIRQWLRRRIRWIGPASWTALIVIVSATRLVDPPTVAEHLALQSLIAVATTGIVCSAVLGGPETRWLRASVFGPVAVGAYSLYLTHQLVIPAALRWTGFPATGGGYVAFLAPFLTLSVLASGALYLGVERPALRFRDRGRTGQPCKHPAGPDARRPGNRRRPGWADG